MIDVKALHTPREQDNPIVLRLLAFIKDGDPWDKLARGYLWAYPIYCHPEVTLKNRQKISKGREKLSRLGCNLGVDIPELLLLIQRGETELPDELKPFKTAFDAGCSYYATGECPYWKADEEKIAKANKAVRDVMVRLFESQLAQS